MTFDKDAVIETERLKLRFLEYSDFPYIYENISHDREVLKYFIMSYTETPEEAEEQIRRTVDGSVKSKRYTFAITLKDTGEVIGMILQCSAPFAYFNTSEIGYALGRRYWNKGYCTEATAAMIDFLFRMGVHKVTATHFTDNPASGRVMQKCGMKYLGIRPDDVFYRDRYWDLAEYYIIEK